MNLFLKGIIIACLIGIVTWGVNAFLSYEQGIGYNKRTAEYIEQENKDLKAALLETERLNKLIQEATNARKKLEEANRIMSLRNNTLLNKLRDTDARINSLLSGASTEALQSAIRAYRELFAECREAYAEMGRAAAGHLADVKQLEAAWSE